MAPRTRNPGSEWLALSAPDPLQIHRLWAREQLAPIPSGRLWLAVEVGLIVDQHDTDGVHDCLVTDRPGCLHVLAQPSCFGFLLFIAVLLAAGGIADLLS